MLNKWQEQWPFSTADLKSPDNSHRIFAEQTCVFLHCQTNNLELEIKLVSPYHLDKGKSSLNHLQFATL